MRPWLPAVAFAVALAAAMVALVPLRAALSLSGVEAAGLSAERVEGSIWSGRLQGARLGAVPLGDLRAGVDSFALLTGTARIGLKGAGAAPVSRAVLVGRRDMVGVEGLDGVLPLASAGIAGLDGTVTLRGATVRFDGAACRTASGQADAAVRVAGFAAPPLTGGLACAPDGRVELRLQGAAGGMDVRAVLALAADGRTVLNTRVRPSDPVAGAVLGGSGFTASGDAWVRTDEGSL